MKDQTFSTIVATRNDRSRKTRRSAAARDLRNACQFELLEGRTLMSAAPLAAPTGLTVTPLSPTSVQLNWKDNAPTATGYEILRATDGVHYTALTTLNSGTATSYTDNTVKAGQKYQYEVEAVKGSTASAAKPTTTTTPLTAVAGLTVQATGPTSVLLNWTDTAGATGYDILRSTDGVHYTQIAQVKSATASSYTDAAAVTGSVDHYEVDAYSASTTAPVSNSAAVTMPVQQITGLTATATGPNAVTLKWTDHDASATGYYILRSTDGVHYSLLTTLTSAKAATYTDSAALSGQANYYIVQAFNTVANAPVSTAAEATTPLVAPTGLTATPSGTAIDLTWTDKDASATGYIVLRSTDKVHYSAIATLSGSTVNSYADAAPVDGSVNYYEIEATDAVSTSAASAAAFATPAMTPVTNLSATATGPTSIALTWTDNDASATGYYILRATDGVHYTQIAKGTSHTATSYTDSTALSGHTYQYEVEAFNAVTTAAASNAASATTPLVAPASLAAKLSGTSVNLTWTDKDTSATGYEVLRSTDGVDFSPLVTLSGNSVKSYTDSSAPSGAVDSYEIVAFDAVADSAPSNVASATRALAAVSGLTATVNGPTSVQLSWKDNDPSATGYYVLHSTDGVHFTQIANVTSGSATGYTDNSAASGQNNEYEVQAYDAGMTAAASAPVTVLTPLIAPSGLTATGTGSAIDLAWTDNDPAATGIFVLRSTDDVHFSTLMQFTNNTADSYNDMNVTAGTTYYYEVVVYNKATTSAYSSVASATITPAPTPPSPTPPSPTPGPSGTVSITTLYGDELAVTATGADDSISITESGTTFSITADGTTYTDPAVAGGLFVYTRGGTDSINVASSVTSEVTLETIDGATTTIANADPTLTAWIDATDVYTGPGNVHRVASFAGGVSKATGASLANPSDSGTTFKATGSLFGTGPVAADINQGEVGDCYFMSSLAAFAGQNPQVLTQSAVDMGDGTYVVQFMNGSTPTYVRVNNSFSSGPFNGYLYAQPGTDGSLWGPVFEKAFCYFRYGENTYNSINSGWMGEVYADLGVGSTNFFPSSGYTSSSFYSMLSTDMNSGDEVTLGTYGSPPNLVGDHAYTLISVSMVNGQAEYVVRNPWGVAGDSIENAQGYATLTYTQMVNNFEDGCAST